MSCFFALSRLKLLLPPAVGSTRMRLPASASVMGFCALLVSAGCDFSPRPARDASTQPQRLAEVAIRVDAPNGGPPSVSVLAYRAAVSGVAVDDDALGIVDPLVAPAPEVGCARARRGRGGPGGRRPRRQGRARIAGRPAAGPRRGTRPCAPCRACTRIWPRRWAGSSARPARRPGGGPADPGPARRAQSRAASPVAELPVLPRLFDLEGSALAANPTFAVRPGSGPRARAHRPGQHLRRAAALRRHLGAGLRPRRPAGDRVIVPAAELGRLAELRVPVSLEAVARETTALVARRRRRRG